MKRVAAIVAATAVLSLAACGDDATQAPSTGERTSAPAGNTDSPFPGRNDSFDPEDPNSLCFGASPDIPSPYEGCPGYSPEQESVARNLPPAPPPAPPAESPEATSGIAPPQ